MSATPTVQPGTANPNHNNAKLEGQQARANAGEAVDHTVEALKQETKAGRAKLKDTYATTKKKAGEGYDRTKSDFKSFAGQISTAYAAGTVGHVYTRAAGENPGTLQNIRTYLKAPFTGPSYVAGHTVSNPSHGAREGKLMAPSLWGKMLAGSVAVWYLSLALAGSSTRYLGFLAKPVPHTAGLASLPNLGWHVGGLSLAMIGIAIGIRVGFAVYAKIQETRAASKMASDIAEKKANLPANTQEIGLDRAGLKTAVNKSHPMTAETVTVTVKVGEEEVPTVKETTETIDVTKDVTPEGSSSADNVEKTEEEAQAA